MTPEQMQNLAKQIAEYGLPLTWPEWALLVIVILVATCSSSFLGAVFAKRGEIIAIKTNLHQVLEQTKQLTTATSAITSNFSRLDWVEQRRWDIKQKYYFDLLEKLHFLIMGYYTLDGVLSDTVAAQQTSDTPKQISLTEDLMLKLKEVDSMLNGIVRLCSVAVVVANQETANLLSSFLDEINGMSKLSKDEMSGKTPTDHFEKIAEKAAALSDAVARIASKDLHIAMNSDVPRRA